ncbi:MAG: glycosyltransferase family 2 protein [Cyclobacteriaceae bacterium]
MTQPTKFRVSVSIINYNCAQYTSACIQSILEKTVDTKYEIIVVDNDSGAEDLSELKSKLPDLPNLKLIESKQNLGFAGGHMLAFEQCQSDYFFVLNSDCLLMNNTIGILADHLDQHPDVGLVTGQMHNWEGERQNSFGYLPSLAKSLLGTGLARLINPRQLPLKKAYEQPLDVPYVTGSAMFFRTATLKEIGGLDTGFFLYCEEEDIAMRIKKSGHKVQVIPEAQFKHYHGGSTNEREDMEKKLIFLREYYISFFRLLGKHYSILSQCLFMIIHFFKNLKKVFKHKNYFNIALTILNKNRVKHSIRPKH